MAELDPNVPPQQVIAMLDDDGRLVLEACRTLYGGRWDDLIEDQQRRRDGRPYCFRIDVDCDRARAWAERMKAYESARGEKLATGGMKA